MRSRTAAYAALVAGSVLGLVAGSRTTEAGSALALAGLAGTLLMLALHAIGRRVAGVALALLGVGMVVLGLTSGPTGWPLTYAAAGVAVAAGGLVTLATGRRWPARPDRIRPSDEPADLWRAQNAGLDPTVDADDPDVPKPPPGGTMKSAGESQRPSRRK